MAVEQLSVIGSPLEGLGENAQGGSLERVRAWLEEQGIKPEWMAVGAVAGGVLGKGAMLKSAFLGAGIAGAMSWIYTHRSV